MNSELKVSDHLTSSWEDLLTPSYGDYLIWLEFCCESYSYSSITYISYLVKFKFYSYASYELWRRAVGDSSNITYEDWLEQNKEGKNTSCPYWSYDDYNKFKHNLLRGYIITDISLPIALKGQCG